MNKSASVFESLLMFILIFRNFCVSTLIEIFHTLMPSEFICSFILCYYSWNNVLFLNLSAKNRFYYMQNILYSCCSQITLCLFILWNWESFEHSFRTVCYRDNFKGKWRQADLVQIWISPCEWKLLILYLYHMKLSTSIPKFNSSVSNCKIWSNVTGLQAHTHVCILSLTHICNLM